MTPTPGQNYHHYKHDPAKGPEHHLYEIVTLGWDTEKEEKTVIYKPLYHSAHLSEHDATVYVRGLANFCEHVEVDGELRPRFSLVEKRSQ